MVGKQLRVWQRLPVNHVGLSRLQACSNMTAT
jgi:hypothetical protein